MKRVLCAGVDAMEFGWSLMKWHAHIRYLAKDYDWVWIFGRPDRMFLYFDFATTCWDVGSEKTPCDKWKYKLEEYDSSVEKLCAAKDMMPRIARNATNVGNHVDVVTPCKAICEDPKLKQKFIKYGKKGGKGYDILIHDRNANRLGDKYTGDRRYKHWHSLVGHLKTASIAWIGTEGSAGCSVDAGDDLRGVSTGNLCDIMANSKVIIGPSSGPMHLASLCGLPHIVFSDKRKWNVGGIKTTNWNRYKKHWNPFKIRCTVIDEYDWHPPVDRVLKALEDYL